MTFDLGAGLPTFSLMKQWLRKLLGQLGYDLVRRSAVDPLQAFPELSPREKKTITAALPFTLTGVDRLAALVSAVNFVSRNRIPGDIAECGVWRGGSMMAVALTLLELGDCSRSLYLYDTFEGMPPPTDADRSGDGETAQSQMDRTPAGTEVWARAGLDDVRANLLSTGYPADQIHFIKGKVEDTIPGTIPGHLALLRLDTDWYESTRHELIHLFPRLDRQGLLIIDDYGHWQGARKAVDEYFAGQPVYLHRIDYTARLLARGGP
jgi:O-methyltransferase